MDIKSVTKYNELIDASYRLSLNEARIILYGISLINPISKEFPLEFKIDIKRFATMFNIESHNVYSRVKQTVMGKFWEREFTLPVKENKKLRMRWLTSVEYGDSRGYIKIFINPQLKPFLHQLSGNFTKYYLKNIARFKSFYSIRFYEISIMHLKRKKTEECRFVMSIDDIKEKLEIKGKYKRFCDLKKYVLEPTKQEIIKYSNLFFDYEVKKISRFPKEIEFTVSKKKKEQLNLPQPKYTSAKLTPNILEKAKKITTKAGTGWDIYAIEQQFYEYMNKKGKPKNFEGAFIGFVKKKIGKLP